MPSITQLASLPIGTRVFPLKEGSKQPANAHAHLEAEPYVSGYEKFPITCSNYGIALDGQFLVVDVDDWEKALADDPLWLNLWKSTWTQRTKRGVHFLFRVPEGYQGKNTNVPGINLKVKGYIVGPGSVVEGHEYTVLNSIEPVPAPEWLLALCEQTNVPGVAAGTGVADQVLQVKEGEGRNQFLTKAAGSLKRLGLGSEQTKAIVRHVNEGVCVPPVTEAELRSTIDQSIEKWGQGKLDNVGPFNREGWINGDDVLRISPPISWWEWGFIPKGALVLQYGPGGKGKSTFAAWLASKVTRAGGLFGVLTGEDPFSLFAIRAHLGGADQSKLWAPKIGSVLLPRDAERLHNIIGELGLDFLYFDSIYDHFQPSADSNMAERARSSLSPLSKIATDLGCTIFGTFHTNKTGRFMGSTEMENVSRVLLATTRGDDPSAPLTVGVEKSNFKKPDYKLQFRIEGSPFKIGEEFQMEEQRDGSLGIAEYSFARKIEDLKDGFVNIDSIGSSSDVAQELIIQFLGTQIGSRAKSKDVKDFVLGHDVSEMSYERGLKALRDDEELTTDGPPNNRYYVLI